MLRRWMRWLWNKDELDRIGTELGVSRVLLQGIGTELYMIRVLLQGPSKQLEVLKPIQPLGKETRQRA